MNVTDHPLAKLVPLLTLHESATKNGKRRLKGFLGGVPVVGFFDDRATTAHPKWDLFVDIAKHEYDLREAAKAAVGGVSQAIRASAREADVEDPADGLRHFLRG